VNENNAWRTLKSYFEKNGWPEYVDENKLGARGTLLEDEKNPGWVIIEIERHRSIAGAQYRRGRPMSAFVTYWMRYGVCEVTGEVKELDERLGAPVVDVVALVSDALEPLTRFELRTAGDEIWRIINRIGNAEQVVTSSQQARDFAWREREGVLYWQEELFKMELWQLSAEQVSTLISEFHAELERQVFHEVDLLWEERNDPVEGDMTTNAIGSIDSVFV